MPLHSLRNNLRSKADFTNDELDKILSCFQLKKIGKNQLFIKENCRVLYEAFVIKGCFKQYAIDQDYKEHILFFITNNMWISDISSFPNSQLSSTNVKALENSEVLIISVDDKQRLLEKFPKLEKMFNTMIQNSYVNLQDRLLNNLMKTAEENYLDFYHNYPNIAKKVTNVNLGSYIGVTPEFISIIRRRIFLKKK